MIENVTLVVIIVCGVCGLVLAIGNSCTKSQIDEMARNIREIRFWVSTQSEFVNASDVLSKLTSVITESQKEIMVEMACIGAKNNADILRLKDGFQVGDVIELGGVRYFVTKRITKVGSNGSLAGYMVVRKDGASEYWEIEEIDSDAKFIKHLDGFDDAFC